MFMKSSLRELQGNIQTHKDTRGCSQILIAQGRVPHNGYGCNDYKALYSTLYNPYLEMSALLAAHGEASTETHYAASP